MQKISLNGQWTMTGEFGSCTCTVPGSVFDTLLKHNLMPNPYYRDNSLIAFETMKEKLFYIKDKKMFFVTGQAKGEPVPNGVYDGVVRRMTDSAKRNEWKNTGRGAMFTGTYTPGTDAASVASSIRSEVTCVGAFNDNLLFTEQIGGTGAERNLTVGITALVPAR